MTITRTPPRRLKPSTLKPISPPGPKRFTVEEFHSLGEAGYFEGKQACLIKGVIFEEGPINPPHRLALELATLAMQAAFGPGWRACAQMPLLLGKSTDPEPDIAMVRGSPRDSSAHPTTAELVVEVSDTSFKFDTGEKLELYASAGIADYWVLDVNDRLLYVFRDPQRDGTYGDQLTLKDTDSVAPLAIPDKPVRVLDMLP
jgi:Uma2 family endonuclease